ncbi:sugar transferase [Leptolyngbya sp. NK1-12]|uniref:Sugar transferase n=1 Tax=Leptolyngbya sp. NK1-12 TaxID=2547451 RepID=A0AA96WLV3_9CYAN|nr:sugar transferase [Leptolyngbya sp. NK1-12]
MSASNVLLTTAKILLLEAPQSSSYDLSHHCTVKWRDGKLWVSRAQFQPQMQLPALGNQAWLKSCLNRSPVKLICLDPNLGEEALKLWADACKQAGKTAFLRLPAATELPQKACTLSWRLKRMVDWLAAALILTLLSPVLIAIALLVRFTSPGPILFKQWRVGERGKLFRVFKFRTMIADAETMHHQIMGNQNGLHKHLDDPRITPLGRWLRKYSLDELPQLFNVLRSEMSLVGPRPWALYDAVRITGESQRRLNALPGITGAWQVQARSTLLDLEAVNQLDLYYLTSWSIQQDLKLLLLTIPKVISGFGAY